MKKIYFARHGLSELNQRGLLAGRTETPLVEEGRNQAKRAGQKAKALNIDAIVSSPQSRALETAQIIAAEIGYPKDQVHENNLLMERDYGALEGKPWAPDLNMDGIADLESEDTLFERTRLALEWIGTLPANNILVVSHGSFGRALRTLLTEHPFHGSERLRNAEIHHWQ
ncbi:hypothetical protein BH23PAT1_BH23PAT1_4300 [soil metagenome]